MTITIRTDALLNDGRGESDLDAAAAAFAQEEGIRLRGRRVTTAMELCAAYDAIGDGAWCWIQDDDTGERIESSNT